jgi:hypothetical protein
MSCLKMLPHLQKCPTESVSNGTICEPICLDDIYSANHHSKGIISILDWIDKNEWLKKKKGRGFIRVITWVQFNFCSVSFMVLGF